MYNIQITNHMKTFVIIRIIAIVLTIATGLMVYYAMPVFERGGFIIAALAAVAWFPGRSDFMTVREYNTYKENILK